MIAKQRVALVSDHPMTLGIQFLIDYIDRDATLAGAWEATGILASSREFARIEAPFSAVEEAHLVDYLTRFAPRVIGISCIERTRTRFMGSLARIRQHMPDAIYVAGGIDAVSEPTFYLSNGVDFVVNGDGEIPLATLLQRLGAGACLPELIRQPPAGMVSRHVLLAPPAASPSPLPLPYYGERLMLLTANGVRPTQHESSNPGHVQFVNRQDAIDMYTQRGCTHQCSFCAQDLMLTYRGDSRRNAGRRDLADVVTYIRQVRQLFSSKRFVYFWDLDFLRKPKRELLRFAEEYREHVGLPFFIFVTEKSVNAAGVDVIRALATAGMTTINMGIQAGTARVLKELYNRHNTPEEARQAIAVIHEATRDHSIEILYDVITYNPHEAPEEILATIKLVEWIPVDGRQTIRLSTHKMSFNTGQPFSIAGVAHTREDYQDFKTNRSFYSRTQSPYLSWLLGQAMRGPLSVSKVGSLHRESLPRLLEAAYITEMDRHCDLTQPLYEALVPLDSDAFVMG